MKHPFLKALYLVLVTQFVGVTHSQDNLPKSLEAASKIVTKDEKSPGELLTQQLNTSIQRSLKNSFYYGRSTPLTADEQIRVNELLECVQSALRGNVFSGRHCKNDFRSLMKGDMEAIRRRGLPVPEEFLSTLQREFNQIQKQVESYESEDKIVVIDKILTFDEVSPDALMNAQAIDPQITSLSQSVKEIVLSLGKSTSVTDGIHKQLAQDVPDELFVLGEMLEMIDGKNCPEDENQFTSGFGGYLLKDLVVNKRFEEMKKNQNVGTGNTFLAVKTDKDLASIKSYRYVEDGKTYYIYPAKGKLNEDNWVMAILRPDGNMKFRYFKLQKVQPNSTDLKTPDDFTVIRPNVQQSTKVIGETNKFFFQAQEGLVLKADDINVPLVGKTIIPEAKLVIGKAHMAYVTKNTFNQADVVLRHDDVVVTAVSMPRDADWATNGLFKYSPISGNWRVESGVRFKNLMVGYGQNSKNASSANMSYIFSRNFINVQSEKGQSSVFSAGRQFANGRGYITASTNLNKVHELTLIFLVK